MLDAGRTIPLPGDFVHEPTGTLIEVDESQHFTSFRLMTLEGYPDDTALGFDLGAYTQLRTTWQQCSDGYYRTKGRAGIRGGWPAEAARLLRRATRPRHARDGTASAHPHRGG